MTTTLQLQSTVRANGSLEVSIANVEVPPPEADEVIVRIEAAPINPSDLGLLFGPADISAANTAERNGMPLLTAPIPAELQASVTARVEKALPVGNEGAGVVVEAGTSDAAQALLGKTVALWGGAMYAQYRSASALSCLPLPEGTSPRDGASCFVNPLTALGMVATMKLEHHSALVHTAAASNLGQMLNKLCLADEVPLVNVVRNPAQAEILHGIGAKYVCNSSDDNFMDELTDALAETNATLAFDAIAGGSLASQILIAMERVAGRDSSPSNRYGSTTHKQVYLYGVLNSSPTVLNRSYGMAWGVGGWLLPNFLARIGTEKGDELRQRVASEITTTFASHYTQVISLAEALQVQTAQRYQRKATGEKYLINPNKDL
ncbi:MAG: zinc-binding dehydrogenase [Proteobacteria bacterium]|nr:zinc-binding dehydrogenase [Pseudomonadota bacterium]